jgi:hypothetical protein
MCAALSWKAHGCVRCDLLHCCRRILPGWQERAEFHTAASICAQHGNMAARKSHAPHYCRDIDEKYGLTSTNGFLCCFGNIQHVSARHEQAVRKQVGWRLGSRLRQGCNGWRNKLRHWQEQALWVCHWLEC